MTTKTILTDKEISKTLVDAGILSATQDVTAYDITIARAIEQAVLQSEQVQAWKQDAERFRKVINMTRAEREEVLFFPCDKDVVHAIRDAMEQQK